MDWLNTLITTAGNTYATVKGADNAPLLAQQNAYGQVYTAGQPVGAGGAGASIAGIPVMFLLLGVGAYMLMKA